MASFVEGVALRVKHRPKATIRPVVINIYAAADNRGNMPASSIAMKPDEATDLILGLTLTLAAIDHTTAVDALTRAADRITPEHAPK